MMLLELRLTKRGERANKWPWHGCSIAFMLSRRSFSRFACLSATGLCLPPARALIQSTQTADAAEPAATRFSVMLWTLNAGRSFEQRLQVVAAAGYRHVELVDEFRTWTPEEFTRNLALLRSLDLTVDATAGVRSGFADPENQNRFLAELKALIPVARRFGSPQIILLSGNRLDHAPAGQQHQAAIETLRRAADLLQQAGLIGVIEPIDRLENPAIYLDGVSEAFALTRAVASPHLKVLYDLYHEQRSQGNLIEKLEKNIDQVGLIHVADVPGRHEPGTGEMNVPNVLLALKRLQYPGTIAMEFYPSGDAVETLRRARLEAEHSLAT